MEEDLWKLFLGEGHRCLYNTKEGKRYGFVRLFKVKDLVRMERRLDNIFIGDKKNVSTFRNLKDMRVEGKDKNIGEEKGTIMN